LLELYCLKKDAEKKRKKEWRRRRREREREKIAHLPTMP
jgi:hypothetical protein